MLRNALKLHKMKVNVILNRKNLGKSLLMLLPYTRYIIMYSKVYLNRSDLVLDEYRVEPQFKIYVGFSEKRK